METLLELRDIHHWYGGFHAVDGVSLNLAQGEVLGLLGPNGAGKSTTMRILSGALVPTGGRVLIQGLDMARQPLQTRRLLGYLPEQPPLYPNLTVDEYLTFAARLRGVPRRQRHGALATAKEQCGLQDHGRRLIGHLSKGYQQRVGIAQALIHRPALVVLDEPTSGLDPNQIREIRDLIRGLGEDHGVLLSTHILPEVEMVCDRVCIMDRGRLVFSDRLDRLRGRNDGLLIQLQQPPPLEQLQQLPGVAGVEPLGEGRFQLTLDEDADSAVIAERSVRNGWILRELMPRRRNLEQVFVDLTSGARAA
ncbi:MAG TPA: ABC transporter ATP-binding protein [Sedimenticola thiotaurini]|uniref:ABC transporter ATP-binding protein n=1 Tax=Sedimenticola thiotaurini TaxID=1543721 RepID=A0A831RPL5_9GAMM|nr:ABC transporter ATP-binding protein [Sedimenticola thiotaurini]